MNDVSKPWFNPMLYNPTQPSRNISYVAPHPWPGDAHTASPAVPQPPSWSPGAPGLSVGPSEPVAVGPVNEPAGDGATDAIPPRFYGGLIGEVQTYCWNKAIQQNGSVATASGMALMALLASRTFQYEPTRLGLNGYFLVLLKSGLGKGAGHSAIRSLIEHTKHEFNKITPNGGHYDTGRKVAGFLEGKIQLSMASKEGLQGALLKTKSLLWNLDEATSKIADMSKRGATYSQTAMKDEIAHLIDETNDSNVYMPSNYSPRTKDVPTEPVRYAALNIFGIGLPQYILENMDENLILSGLLPRFTMFNDNSNGVKTNENTSRIISHKLSFMLADLAHIAYVVDGKLEANEDPLFVYTNPEADTEIKRLTKLKDDTVKKAHDDNKGVKATLYSRLMAKIFKTASYLAISEWLERRYQLFYVTHKMQVVLDWHIQDMPIITRQNILDAYTIEVDGTLSLIKDMDDGKFDSGDAKRKAIIWNVFVKMIMTPKKFPQIKISLIEQGIVQLALVKNYCEKLAEFRNHKLGSAKAFDDAIRDMLTYNEIERVAMSNSKDYNVTLNKEICGPLLQAYAKEQKLKN